MLTFRFLTLLAATFVYQVNAGGDPNQVLVEGFPGGEGTMCPSGGPVFSFDHLVAAIQHAVVKFPEARVGPSGGKNPYPHPYTQAEVVPVDQDCKDAKASANMYEFPIPKGDDLYEGGAVSGTIEERIFYRVDQADYRQNGWNGQATAFYCAIATHQGAVGNKFVQCPDPVDTA